MGNGTLDTDGRIGVITGAGESLKRALDPEGMLRGCLPLHLSADAGSGLWKLLLAGQNGTVLSLAGRSDADGTTIEDIRCKAPGEDWQKTAATASKTLRGAFQSLAGIPANLKRILRPPGETEAKNGNPPASLPELMKLTRDALLWGCEKPDRKDFEEDFKRFDYKFPTGKDGAPARTEFMARHIIGESCITVSADADVYGLGNKRVSVKTNLGMEHTARIDCTFTTKKGTVPSIRAAYDLARRIPVIYGTERSLRKNLPPNPEGKPQAAKAK